jgi:hypothetical protein
MEERLTAKCETKIGARLKVLEQIVLEFMHTISLANDVGRILAAVHSLYSTIVVRITRHSVIIL